MSWRSSSSNSKSGLLRFSKPGRGLDVRPGSGIGRGETYSFGLLFETDLGISFA
jgi:hypothetical protein